MTSVKTKTMVGSMTAERKEENLEFELEGISDHLDFGHGMFLCLESFSSPDLHNLARPATDERQSLWSFAVWLGCRQAAASYAREVGLEGLGADMERMADDLRNRISVQAAKAKEIEAELARWKPGTPERVVLRGKLERIRGIARRYEWQKTLAEDLAGAAKGLAPSYTLPAFEGWPKVAVGLPSGGKATVSPQVTGDVEIAIDLGDKVELDGFTVHGLAFYERPASAFRKGFTDVRAYRKWPPEEWTPKAAALFDEALEAYLSEYRELDAEVLRYREAIERDLLDNHADELELFRQPRNYVLPSAATAGRIEDANAQPKMTEIGPGHFRLTNLPPFVYEKNAHRPVANLVANFDRCDDGELALDGWAGVAGKSHATLQSGMAYRPEIDLYVAAKAIEAMSRNKPKGKKRERA